MRRRVPILKRLIPSVKKFYCRIFWKDGKGTVRSNGALFHLNYKNFVDRQIAFYGDYEDRQLAYLTGELSRIGADTFLDIGANIGFYAIILATNVSLEKIVAFEPDARNMASLTDNIALNDLADLIEVHQLAASSHDGALGFQPGPDNSTGQSKVVIGEEGAESVNAVTIDDFLSLADRAIGIKIDVEGHELDVLEGMRRTLRENNCLLQIEVYGDNIPLVTQFLSENGYNLTRQLDHDHFFSR